MTPTHYAEFQRLAAALLDGPPRVHHILVSHDHDCPALGTGEGCICTPEVSEVDRAEFLAACEKTRQQRRAAERAAAKALAKATKGGRR